MSSNGGRRFIHQGSVSSKDGMTMIKSALSGSEQGVEILSDGKGSPSKMLRISSARPINRLGTIQEMPVN